MRSRIDDIPLLAAHFISTLCERHNRDQPRLTQHNIRQLQSYHWSGNVRELQNIIERAIIVGRGGRLEFDLPGADNDQTGQHIEHETFSEQEYPYSESERLARDKSNILAALKITGGKVSGIDGAAELLGIKPTTLASRMACFLFLRRAK